MSGPLKAQWLLDPGSGPFLGGLGDDLMLVTGGRAAGGGGDDWLTTGPGVPLPGEPAIDLYGDNDPKTPEDQYQAPGDDVLNGGRGVKSMHSGGQANDGDGSGDAYWFHGEIEEKDAIKALWADHLGGDYFVADNSDTSKGEGTGITTGRIRGKEMDVDADGDADVFVFKKAMITAHSTNPAVREQNWWLGFNDDGYGEHVHLAFDLETGAVLGLSDAEVDGVAVVSGPRREAKEIVREWVHAGVSDGMPDAGDFIL